MNIVDFIPYGKENGVTRDQLKMLTGFTDRAVRKEIERLRTSGVCILNHQNGTGYYRPNKDETAYVKRYIRQEESRLKSIRRGLRGANDFLKG